MTDDLAMKALTGTVAVSGTILFIIIGATTFSQVLSFSGATNGIVSLISAQGLSATVLVFGMMGILLFLGCFVDQVSIWGDGTSATAPATATSAGRLEVHTLDGGLY